MSPWQYHVRRGWKFFYVFYQKRCLNMSDICKQWRLMMGLFKHKKTRGWVAPGRASLFHLSQDQTWIKHWFNNSFLFPSPIAPCLLEKHARGGFSTGDVTWNVAVAHRAKHAHWQRLWCREGWRALGSMGCVCFLWCTRLQAQAMAWYQLLDFEVLHWAQENVRLLI